jgi:hypothetical protein
LPNEFRCSRTSTAAISPFAAVLFYAGGSGGGGSNVSGAMMPLPTDEI